MGLTGSSSDLVGQNFQGWNGKGPKGRGQNGKRPSGKIRNWKMDQMVKRSNGRGLNGKRKWRLGDTC